MAVALGYGAVVPGVVPVLGVVLAFELRRPVHFRDDASWTPSGRQNRRRESAIIWGNL